ncbi:MAG: four-helix bundle copper-binding protein [Planctomycetes bacterium]|nr:four-helix bundle copper-binding protein [Planctomycetota bacterium]
MTVATQSPLTQLGDDVAQCIALCQDAHRTCVRTFTHCSRRGGLHGEPQHLRLLLDCAQICQTSADFLLRGSDLYNYPCGVCAYICDRCADDCESIAAGDPLMAQCIRACRDCAHHCLHISKARKIASPS